MSGLIRGGFRAGLPEEVDETTEEVVCCPAGHAPENSEHNSKTGRTKAVMPESACGPCEFRKQCSVTQLSQLGGETTIFIFSRIAFHFHEK